MAATPLRQGSISTRKTVHIGVEHGDCVVLVQGELGFGQVFPTEMASPQPARRDDGQLRPVRSALFDVGFGGNHLFGVHATRNQVSGVVAMAKQNKQNGSMQAIVLINYALQFVRVTCFRHQKEQNSESKKKAKACRSWCMSKTAILYMKQE